MAVASLRKAAATPWFRVPMVWLLIAIPLASVAMGIVMLVLSISSYDGLVADDYYRRGKEINRVLARDRAAVTHGVTATAFLDPDTRVLRIELAAAAGFSYPEAVEAHFMHPTRSGEDLQAQALRAAEGTYIAVLPPLAAGRWLLQIGTAQWRLSGNLWLPAREPFVLRPLADPVPGS